MDFKEDIKEIIAEIEKKGDVKAVFGEPIREGGITIIPVASLAMCGGGGGGRNDEKISGIEGEEDKWPKLKGKGFGMGYKKRSQPVGYIKIENNQALFIPITDWNRIIPVAAGIAGVGLIMLVKMILIKLLWRKHHQKDLN